MKITNEIFPSGNPAIFIEGVADKEFWLAPSRAVELSLELLKAAQQSVHLTAFGAGWRYRAVNFLINLAYKLAPIGGR